jgi:hypothetical protein
MEGLPTPCKDEGSGDTSDVRGSVLLAVAIACIAGAGCGSGDVREIHAWRSDAPYIPPPDPGAAGKSLASPEVAAARPSRRGAPSDAEVAHELEHVYANAGHAFMTVAGLRFDTSGRAEGGSRWQARSRPVAGFAVRHPPGL